MYRDKMDLRIKLATLPFTDFRFYFQDDLAEIGSKRSSADYKRYMEREFVQSLLPTLHQTDRIQQLDEIALLAEKFYPHRKMNEWTQGGQRPEQFYIHRLKELSSLFLTHRNGKVALKYWESSGEKQSDNSMFSAYRGIYKVALWNSLNRMMCVDLLVMVHLLTNGMRDENVLRAYHALVYLPDTQLDRVLDKGVAETHLHMSAAGQFNLNWQTIMSPTPRVLSEEERERHTYIDKLTGKRPDLQLYTLAAAAARLVLAAYLQSLQSGIDAAGWPFAAFLQSYARPGTGVTAGLHAPPRFLKLVRLMLEGKDLAAEGYRLEELYAEYEETKVMLSTVDVQEREEWTWSQRMAYRDTLSSVFGVGGGYTSHENVLLFRSLRHMLDQPEDTVFAKLFWQYVRVKNARFAQAVQRNHIRGLPYFKDYFERGTGVSLAAEQIHYYGFLLHHQLQSDHLRKLEVRMKPSGGSNVAEVKRNTAQKLFEWLTAYAQILRERERLRPHDAAPLVGVIFHFIKMPDAAGQDKCWYEYSEAERNYETLSFKTNQLGYQKEMKAVCELREQIPGLADYVVGIDAANLETAVEPWVFAPIFRQARNSDTHRLIYDDRPAWKIRNLGLTYHVGEDFRHMLTGLRHLDEVIEHFQFRAGDRIGHGMVLGVQAEKWAARNRVVILPRIEALENWLWVWGMCRDGNPFTNLDAAFLENRILRLAEAIYGSMNGITVYLLWKSYQSKFQGEIGGTSSCGELQTREEWRAERPKQDKRWTAGMLSRSYHCQCFLAKMQEPIEVEITREEEGLIGQVQQAVLRRVSREGIVIETNPSSNTAIGEVEHIFEHYIHQLNQRGLSAERQVERGVMVSINTDDPVVFNTNIDNEFAYIFYALHEKGYAREDILQWIDHVRETGITSSFIETRHIAVKDLRIEIETLIGRLNEYLRG